MLLKSSHKGLKDHFKVRFYYLHAKSKSAVFAYQILRHPENVCTEVVVGVVM